MSAEKCEWYFPDAYLPDISDGVSHEAVCVLNIGEADANLSLTLYFESSPPMERFAYVCGANRTVHIRLDKLLSPSGEPIPQCTPYAIRLCSDVPVYCQYTRVDASLPQHALMTTMGL